VERGKTLLVVGEVLERRDGGGGHQFRSGISLGGGFGGKSGGDCFRGLATRGLGVDASVESVMFLVERFDGGAALGFGFGKLPAQRAQREPGLGESEKVVGALR